MTTSKKATLEDAWAIIRELGKSQQELRESQKEETDRQMKETSKALQSLSEDVKKQGGNFDNKWGAFLESFVEGDLVNLLQLKRYQS